MGIERLIVREKPENIMACKVVQLDPGNRKLKVRIRVNLELWVGYDPTSFGGIVVEDDVLIARSGSSGFLLEKIPRSRPDEVTVVAV